MKHIVDIETWSRRDNYRFFQGFDNCWMSLTTEFDCTTALQSAKRERRSFFIHYLYAILRAVNEVPEMRYRTDSEGRVCYYDTVDALTPIAMKDGGFYSVRIPFKKDFNAFYDAARSIVEGTPSDGNPYTEENAVIEKGDYDVILLSAVPKLYFTGYVPTMRSAGQAQLYPLFLAGKAIEREGRWWMPLAWTFSHEFVDGEHFARFAELVQQYLNTP